MQECRLAAILFTDIVGLTALIGSDEDHASDWYEKAYEMHDPKLRCIRADLCHFNKLDNNPGYIKLLKKMNLPLS